MQTQQKIIQQSVQPTQSHNNIKKSQILIINDRQQQKNNPYNTIKYYKTLYQLIKQKSKLNKYYIQNRHQYFIHKNTNYQYLTEIYNQCLSIINKYNENRLNWMVIKKIDKIYKEYLKQYDMYSIQKNNGEKIYKQKNNDSIDINSYLLELNNSKILDPQCLGCISQFYSNQMYNFNKYNQNYLIEYKRKFQNQKHITQNICALLNCGGGFMFIMDDEFVENKSNIQGIILNNNHKQNYKIFIQKCTRYIQPNNQLINYSVQFIPAINVQNKQIVNNGQDKNIQKYVIRISIRPLKSKYLYYIGYKLQSNQKLIQAQFFNIDRQGNVYIMEVWQAYQKIHQFHNYKYNNQQKSVHPGILCRKPIKILINQPIPLIQNNSSLKQWKKHKYSILILKLKDKDPKADDKKSQQLKLALINQKILFSFQNIVLSENKTIWLISYDCHSQIIQNILKNFNRAGDLTIHRVYRNIQIGDQLFMKNKDKILNQLQQKIAKYKININDNTPISYKIQKDLYKNAYNKKIIVKFKHIGDAILAFGFLFKNFRRIDFVSLVDSNKG